MSDRRPSEPYLLMPRVRFRRISDRKLKAATARIFNLAISEEPDCRVIADFVLDWWNASSEIFGVKHIHSIDKAVMEDIIAIVLSWKQRGLCYPTWKEYGASIDQIRQRLGRS